VFNHYLAAHPLPIFTLQPTNSTASENGPLSLAAAAYGPSLAYQWYQSPDQSSWTPVSGQAAATLYFASTAATNNNSPYFEVVATNLYGAATSSVATVTVVTGAPQIYSDLPASLFVYAGAPISLSVGANGTLPFTYAWTLNGTNLPASYRITGLQSNVLTIANAMPGDSGNYQVTITSGANSTPSAVASVTVEPVPNFNGSGTGWSLAGGASIASDALTLTDGGVNEARAAWFNYPLYIGAFQASFTYQDVGGGVADGMAFVVQNDPRGVAALGANGGSLGYDGGANVNIKNSVAMLLNLYSGSPGGASGILFTTNGVGATTNTPYVSTAPVNLDAGNPIAVNLHYNGGRMQVTLSDLVASNTYTTNFALNLPALVGANAAWVGLTGGDGSKTSTQVVSNFTFVPLSTLSIQRAGANAVLSWPSAIGGYLPQSQVNLADPNPADWAPVSAPILQTNNQNQVTVTPAGSGQFYRLILPAD
jgi:hypothetical protein